MGNLEGVSFRAHFHSHVAAKRIGGSLQLTLSADSLEIEENLQRKRAKAAAPLSNSGYLISRSIAEMSKYPCATTMGRAFRERA
jgi:hypothetical protein